MRGKKKEGDEFGEDNTFGGLKAYNDIRSALKDLPEVWAKIDNESVINQIAYILTTQKTNEGNLPEFIGLLLSYARRFAPGLIATKSVKPCDGGVFGALNLLLISERQAANQAAFRPA